VKTKKLASAAAVGAVTAVTTLLLGATPALAQDSKGDSAFALSASGVLDINPISPVKSVDGKLVHDELLSIGDVAGPYEDDIAFGLLTSEAEAHRAETVVKEVNLLDILKADVIRTSCKNGKGDLEIINGSVLGHKLPNTSVPGKVIDVSPLVKVALNQQKRGTDGSLTVTGIKITVLPGKKAVEEGDKKLTTQEKATLPVLGSLLGKELPADTETVNGLVGQLTGTLALDGDLQTITIGSATCREGGGASGGGGDSDDDGKSKDDNGKDDKDGKGNGKDDKDGKGNGKDDKDGKGSDVKSAAPAPTVVKAALPVTG
jgi:hypothetical protein